MAFSDARVLWQLMRGQSNSGNLQDRLTAFYGPQAHRYDDFRERLLHGRGDLIAKLPIDRGTRLVELGGGTGRNLAFFGDRLKECASVQLLDFCPPLLEQAKLRAERSGWTNVELIEGDATVWQPRQPVDIVYFSYALTMIPDWFSAIDNAIAMLKPGGILAVVDFYVSRRVPEEGRTRHGGFTRHFWPFWFAHDGVHPSADHLPYLTSRLDVVEIEERRAAVPYLIGLTTPYYLFIGRRPCL